MLDFQGQICKILQQLYWVSCLLVAVNYVRIPSEISKYENFDKVQGRKRITSKEGTYDFFPTVAKYCPRSTKYVRWWNLCRRVSAQLTPQGGHSPKISNRHNSGPEVDIDKPSTAFFTVRRPLRSGIKTFRQGPPQVSDLEKVPRPQNFQTPISQKLVVKSLRNFANI